VREYLRYVAAMKDIGPSQTGASVDRALDSAAVAHVAHRLIGTLSKGYRQRVGIAQALLGQPRVLILDEPTAGLDPEQVAEMRHLIRSLRGDSTVILSTHILPEVEATCDRVIIINQGRMLAVDTPQNLNQRLRQTSQIYLEIIGPADLVPARLRAVPGVLSVELSPHVDDGVVALTVATAKDLDLRAELAAHIAAARWGLRELRPVALSLEAIFLSLVAAPDSSQASVEHEVPGRLSA
jgi:ABC-2 type transport system ATP-binding protein